MLSPQVTWYIPTSKIPDFLSAGRPVWNEIKQQPECLFFDMFQSTAPNDPDVTMFRIVEVWAVSEEWYTAVHANRDYVRTMFETMQRLAARPPDFMQYQTMDLWRFGKGEWGFVDQGIEGDGEISRD